MSDERRLFDNAKRTIMNTHYLSYQGFVSDKDNWEKFLYFAQDVLSKTAVSDTYKDVFEKLLINLGTNGAWKSEFVPTPNTPRIHTFHLPFFRYVIPDDDLKLLETLCAVAVGVTAIDWDETNKIVAAVAAVFLFCRNAYRQGVILDPMQNQVIVALKALGGCAPVTLIKEWMDARLTDEQDLWQESIITETLGSLTSLVRRNGKPLSVVTAKNDGTWILADI